MTQEGGGTLHPTISRSAQERHLQSSRHQLTCTRKVIAYSKYSSQVYLRVGLSAGIMIVEGGILQMPLSAIIIKPSRVAVLLSHFIGCLAQARRTLDLQEASKKAVMLTLAVCDLPPLRCDRGTGYSFPVPYSCEYQYTGRKI